MKKGIVLMVMIAATICAAAETTKTISIRVPEVKETEFEYVGGKKTYNFSGVKITTGTDSSFDISTSTKYSDAEYIHLWTRLFGGIVEFSLDEEYEDWKIQEIKINISSLSISYIEDESKSAGWTQITENIGAGYYFWKGDSPQKSVGIWGDIAIYYIDVTLVKNEYLTIGDADYVMNSINGHYFAEEENLEFPDGSKYNLNYDAYVKNLTYTRFFDVTLGVWQAWAVPFDVDVETLNEQGLEVAEIAGIVIKDSEPYVGFIKMNDGIVKGNVPYVVRANKELLKLQLEDVMLMASNKLNILTIQSAYDNFTFTPVMKAVSGNGLYALNLKGEFQLMGDIIYYPQRFTLAVEHRTDTPYYKPYYNVKAYKIMVMGDDDSVDSINTVDEDENENEDGNMYNLSGLRVDKNYKGIVIKDGKKILIR